MKEYLVLFFTFAKVGVMTFGGGYAMIPILQREISDKKNWATSEELMDYYAIGQCTPGVIAINTATFIGNKRKGFLGGIIATLGLVFPSLIIILFLASVISNFSHLAVIQHAFAGIRACVCVLIFNAITKLYKSSVVDTITLIIFLLVAIFSFFTSISPVILVMIAAVLGVVIKGIGGSFHGNAS